MAYSHQQFTATIISMKCTSALSFFSSAFIIRDILKQRWCNKFNCCSRWCSDDDGGGPSQQQYKKLTTMQRVLIGMSILDLGSSAAFFIGPWAIPAGSPTFFDEGSPLAPKGNEATCTAQGFFLQLGLGITLYQTSLSAFYYLTVCKNWKEERQFKKYQWLFHTPPVIWGISTGLYGSLDEQFNNAYFICSWTGTDLSMALLFGLFYAPLWLSFLICLTLQLLIWRKVRTQENRISRYSFNPSQSNVQGSSRYSFTPSQSNVQGSSDSNIRTSSTERGVVGIGVRSESNSQANNGEGVNDPTVTTISTEQKHSRGLSAMFNRKSRRSSEIERKYSRGVMMQALYFGCAFVITFIFMTIMRLYGVANPGLPPFPLFYLAVTFFPSQGFWNLIVYKRITIQKFLNNLLGQCKSSLTKQQQNDQTTEGLSSGNINLPAPEP